MNGVALLLVGTPVWAYSWHVIQDLLADPAEMGSTLRLGILYLLALGGVITVLTTAFLVINTILSVLLGQEMSFHEFIREVGGPISIGVPLGLVWAYYGYWLNRHIAAVGDRVRRAALKRLYNYVLSLIGVVVAFVGVTSLFRFIIDMVIGPGMLLTDTTRGTLTASIASIVVGLPLWLTMWRPMQAEALTSGRDGRPRASFCTS